jgi:hypothetical protein
MDPHMFDGFVTFIVIVVIAVALVAFGLGAWVF